jgi:hypothetical protein
MRVLKPINRHRTKRVMAERKMAQALLSFFNHNKEAMLKPLLSAYKPRKPEKALDPDIEKELERLLAKLDTTPFEELEPELRAIYEGLAKDGMILAARQVADYMDEEAFESMLKLVNKRAVALALTTAGKKIKDFADTTPEMLRSDIAQALTEGWTTDDLAKVLMENRGFNSVRAQMIARTEIAAMDIQSNLEIYKEANIGHKVWLISEEPCELCEENRDAGVIPMEEEFPNGDAPVHPNCTCDISPVLMEE